MSRILLAVALLASVCVASATLAQRLEFAERSALSVLSQKRAISLSGKLITPPPPSVDAVPSNITASVIRGVGEYNLRGFSSIPPIYSVAEPSASKSGCLHIVNYAGAFVHTYCGFPRDPLLYSNQQGNVSLGGLAPPVDGPYTLDLYIALDGQLAFRWPNGTVRLFGNMFPYYCIDGSDKLPCDIDYDEPQKWQRPWIRSSGEDAYEALDTVPLNNAFTPLMVYLNNPATLGYLNNNDLAVSRASSSRVAWALNWNVWEFPSVFDYPYTQYPVLRTALRDPPINGTSAVQFDVAISSMQFTIVAAGETFKREAPVVCHLSGSVWS